MNIKTLQNKNTDDLFKAILTLNNVDECYAFFCDLCTPNELNLLVQRLQIARELRSGDSLTNVCKRVTASSATVSNVKRQLIFGNDGFNLVLDRLEEVDKYVKN